MKRHVRKLISASLGLAIALSGVAYAHPTEFPTDISVARSPRGAVAPGTTVHIYGKLSSPKRACIRRSTIQLIRVGKGVVATTVTTRRGRYAFDRRVWNTARWRVRFPGKVLNAVHPHSHTCEASSAGFRIRVV